MHRFLTVAAIAALFSGSLQAAPFSNGSFETGVTGDERSTVPANWTGQVEYFSAATYGLAAYDGLKLVDLAWYTSNPSSGNLSQTFDTVAGQLYKVDFQFGNSHYATRGGASSMSVGAIGDYVGGTFSIAATNLVPISWSAQSFTFKANGPLSTLTMSSTVNSFAAFAFVDAVSVSAVPEASTLVMSVAGLGVLAGATRRRRNRV